jgi:hypothetical protein
MTNTELQRLADRIEGDAPLSPGEAAQAAQLIDAACPGRPVWRGVRSEAFGSTDAMLGLVAEALPSWSVHLGGSSAQVAGRWTCTIREGGVRDDDETIGVGQAATAADAVAAALLKVLGMRGGAG